MTNELPQERLVVRLSGAGFDAAMVGSKAAGLDRLIGHDFQVPDAVAVTTRAYEEFVEHADLPALIAELSARPMPTPAIAEDWRREVDDAFLHAPMPAALVEAVGAAVEDLGHPLAVRSSAAAEDLAEASFAGQYRSVLSVEGLDETLEAVRLVWASLWHPWAAVYRRQMGITDAVQTMAVVIQKMVRAERSGVVFTRDPAGPGLLRLETVAGLGDQLVSGDVTPDLYRLRRPSLRCIDGRDLSPGLRNAAHASLLVEERFGNVPQDVEWSIAAGELWILQARPITTVDITEESTDGFDTRLHADDVYVPAGITEMLPGVLPPLLWTINGPMVEEAFRSLFHRLGSIPDSLVGPFGFIARRRGRARLNLTAVQSAAAGMAGWSAADVERLYLGAAVSEDEPAGGGFLRNLGLNRRAFRIRAEAPHDAAAFRSAVEAVLDAAADPTGMLDFELVAYRSRLRDLAYWGMRAEVAVAAVAVAAYRALEAMLERWLGDEAAVTAQHLAREAASGIANPATAAHDFVLALSATESEAMAGIIDGSGETEDPSVGDDVAARLEAVVDRLGSAAVYAGPTWSEQAESFRSLVRTTLRRDEEVLDGESAETELRRVERRLKKLPRWRLIRILTGQVVDMRIRLLRRLAADAGLMLRQREGSKGALLALGGRERAVILELADRLVASGALGHRDDVASLADWELEALAVGGGGPSRPELDRRRMVLDRWQAEAPAGHAPVPGAKSSDVLVGWGASPGSHRGPVRVVFDPVTAGDIEPGSVVVAPATDPSWVLLFRVAGALVVERGGPLSHAAIVAREFGIPAVLNVPSATTALASGSVVEVDGSKGEVRIVSTADQREEVI